MKFSRELQVGLAALVAVIIFFLGMRFFQDLPLFRGTYTLYSEFEDTSGLQSGNAVRINGVKVGTVEGVQLTPDKERVRVQFHLDSDVSVPEGTRARVSGMAFFGNTFLRLRPGPSTNPALAEGSYVPADPQQSTLQSLLDDLNERGPQMVDRMDSVLVQTNVALDEATATFRETRYLVGNANSDLRQTLASFESSANTLDELIANQQPRVANTLTNLEQFSSELSALTAENRDSLRIAVGNLNRLTTNLDRNLSGLDTTTLALNTIVRRINQGEGSLGRLVNDPSIYLRLDSAATNLNVFMEQLQRDPGRYLREMRLIDIF